METREAVDILRIAPGGEGVAHRQNGEILFVASTVPGDRVEVGELKRVQGVWRGQVLRVLNPSAERRELPCPHASNCGGCDFMQLLPAAQEREKLGMLQDALARVGGDPERPTVQFVRGSSTEGYRSRLRLHVDGQGNVGMLSSRSHHVVALDRCRVADNTINSAIARLRDCDSTAKKRLQFVEQIELRSSPLAPHLVVRLFSRKQTQIRPELYAPIFPEGSVVVVAGSRLDDDMLQYFPIDSDVTLSVPCSAFTQANPAVNQKLVQAVVDAAKLRQCRTFLDAYAGAGNFAIPLLKAGLTGEAVDSASAGIFAARALARDLGLPFTGFSVGEAAKVLSQWRHARRRFDYIVLDPPRGGAKSVVELALDLKPRTLALIGCDPVALARDLGTVTQDGARIESLTMFDMFPETHHSETLAIVDCAE